MTRLLLSYPARTDHSSFLLDHIDQVNNWDTYPHIDYIV